MKEVSQKLQGREKGSTKAYLEMWHTGLKQSHKTNFCHVSNVSFLRKVIAFGLLAQREPGFPHQAQTWPLGEPTESYACLTMHTGDGENAYGLCAPEVLAAQGLQALSQGAVQAGLGPLPRRLEEGREELPEQAQQEGVSDQFGADDAWVHCVGGDPCA